MADKYTKIEPKIHPITLSIIIGFFVIVVSLIIIFQPKNQELIYAAYEPNATADFTEDHPFYSITYNGSLFKRGLDTIIEKNEIVALYIGFPECPSCNAHIGAFQKYFINEGFDQYVSQIYYINANTDQDGMQDLLDLYIDIATTTPQLVIFKDGVIIATFEPASADDPILINRSVRDFYRDAILAINEE